MAGVPVPTGGLANHAEQLLARRVVMTVCAVALATMPLIDILLGANESWITGIQFVALALGFALLGRTQMDTARVICIGAVMLWLATLTSVGMTAAGTVAGTTDGAGLGSGALWLAAGVGPALFLVLPLRRALGYSIAAAVGFIVLVAAVTRGDALRLGTHPGVWQIGVSIVVVLGTTAAVAWLAGRSAQERWSALLLRQERAAEAARLAADQQRRAALFSRTSEDLRSPMADLGEAVEPLRHARTDGSPDDAEVTALARVVEAAGDVLDQVVEQIDGLVRSVHAAAGTGRPEAGSPSPVDDEPPVLLATVLMTFGVFAMIGLDAWRLWLLAQTGFDDPHVRFAAANRMVVVLFVAAAILAVRFPGRFGWWLTGLALLTYPVALLRVEDVAVRTALLGTFAPAWRNGLLAAAMLAVLAVIIERRVRDRDSFVAAAHDEDTRAAQVRRRDEAADLAYAEAAHELKNPLSVIQGAARTLLDHGDRLPAATAGSLRGALVRAVDRLGARLGVMRGLADGGHQPGYESGARRPVAAADVLLDALAVARIALGERPVDVDVRVTGQWTSAAPADVEHVVENLLANADKYGDPAAVIRLTAHRDGDDVVVEVVNRGGGLSRADAARVFEPYWRAANAEQDDVAGTGLGLAVVARLVEQWGGRSWCRVGGGATRVGFTMPVAESVQAPTWQQLQDQLD